jgi:hypothetical protein
MLGITNLKPIESINSVLQPLGLKVSNKEQMISKLAWGALATLTICSMLSTVEGRSVGRSQYCRNEDSQIEACKAGCPQRVSGFYDYANALANCYRGCVGTYRTSGCRTPYD